MYREKKSSAVFPCMTIGVMGSAGGELTDEVRQSLRRLGALVAERQYVLITGACPGLPHEAVLGANERNGFVVGISPALNIEEHITKYQSPTRGYDAIIYTGSGLMGREIENIRSCDAVIFAGGRSGTLGEFAIAYDEGKVIGILEGTGGITKHLLSIISMVEKETGAIICSDSDPERLLGKLENAYNDHVLPRYRKILDGHDPDGVME